MSGPLGSSQWMYASGYEIEQSLRFNDDDTAYLTRTISSASNRRTYTISVWVKRANLGTSAQILGVRNSSEFTLFYFSNHAINFYSMDGSNEYQAITNALHRDTSAWYHIVCSVDTTQGTQSNRVKIYVNGEQQSLSTNNYPLNFDTYINSTLANGHQIGRQSTGADHYDGYLAEMHLVDGQALTPADFGTTGTYGEWKPKEYTGSYGTNGFYLPFENDYTVEGFSTVTWKGNGVHGNYIGGVGFKPDFTWVKMRSHADNHVLSDIVRGHSSVLYSNLTNAETTSDNFVTARSSDGFSVGTDNSVNYSSGTHVAWNWDMGADTPTGFSCVLSTGNATVKEVGGVGFQPDLVINETRSAHQNNFLYDAIRGPRRVLRTNHDVAEADSDALTAFRPDGFMRGSGNDGNENNVTYVDWCWNMGGTSVANTTGDINSTVMANTTYGQSIVSYTGNGSAGQTVGHGLSSAPEMIWVKNTTDIDNWCVYCKTGGVIDETDFLRLDATNAVVDDADRWNDTAATSSVFTVDTDNQVNGSNDEMIAYCWHSVSGYSKIGSYSGDGTSDGSTVISCGFRPAWVMIKCINDTESWWVWDNVRNPFTNTQYRTAINSESTETSNVSTSADNITFTSTGFALTGSGGGSNQNGNTYIFMAFAGGLDSIAPVNTDGSIDSRVKASTTYGQSVVSYVGTGSATTFGHGLSSAPEMVVVKSRDASENWVVFHTGISSGQGYIKLNSTDAPTTGSSRRFRFGNDSDGVLPDSTKVYIGSGSEVNTSGNDYIAYCFHSVTGYSKFGKYTGNGNASGTSVTTGFEPAFVLVKGLSGDMTHKHWTIRDNTRSPNNDRTKGLHANKTEAEFDASNNAMAFSSTGFQLKGTDPGINENGIEYIYMAFADTREYAYWLDQSGNNNDWTSNNLTESDISVDSPSNNFATMNPLANANGGTIGNYDSDAFTVSEGNLKTRTSGQSDGRILNTLMPATGKWYFEFVVTELAENNRAAVSVGEFDSHLISQEDQTGDHYMLSLGSNTHDRLWYYGNEKDDYNYTPAVGDVWQFAFDITGTTHKIWIRQNAGNWFGTSSSTFASGSPAQSQNKASADTVFYVAHNGLSGSSSSASTVVFNFGQDSSFAGNKTAQGNQDSNSIGDFFYTPPTGFLALCTKNLPDVAVTPSGNFNTVLYTGNGSTNAITVGFQPDFVWGKDRSGTDHNHLFDAVRGTNQRLISNATSAENTESNCLDSFDTNGFTLGSNTGLNNNNDLHVAWNWNMGGTTASNTSGSITSSVRANPSAGQSIVTYTGTGSNATVGHGLTSAPGFIVVKTRNNTGDWMVFYGDNTDFLKLNEYNDTEDLNTVWNDTSPTSSVFTIGTNSDVNVNGRTYVAYCFSSIDGYSSVGTYEGNAGTNDTDGTFVYTGFRPAWVMCKLTSLDGESWLIKDNKRSPFNPADEWLYADKNSAEATASTALRDIDFVSNGFKFRGWSTELNGNGESYTYLAFAETPFKYANAR